MIRSMTGYGKGQAEKEGCALTVEIRSVNHRYCDVTVKAPKLFMPYESRLRQKISERLKRGKVDVFVTLDALDDVMSMPVVNRPLAGAYMKIFEGIKDEYALGGDVPLSLLMMQKDVIVLRQGEYDEEAAYELLTGALSNALDAVESMRISEGRATSEDIMARLATSETLLDGIVGRAPQVPLEWRNKLEERLKKYDLEISDPQRIAQEIAIFSDRCDISEEITRFNSHLEQFRLLLDSEEPVGRQMDFLVQELNRETNTMGSKSNDAELTRFVVSLKAELEKIREQVQNIE